ncbi:MAG: relaxase MobL [Oscillospiraceae bacterium]|nr:relaxase MobL [Oscillospiraceae bacterium]
MPKIIVTSRYIKPNAHKRFGNYIKYIATREGVEKPIPKQKVNRELDQELFMNYLDSRPNSHGLFSETDKTLVLDKVAKEVANHEGAIWTHIVSLKREDAERMGYIDLKHWRDLVRRHISDIASAQKIAPENIRWYAAFHNKESNPHVHIVVYSDDPHEGYLTSNGIEKIRSAFANDIYKDELQNLYQQQNAVRDKLRSEAENVMRNLLLELNNSHEPDPQLEQFVLKLQSQLRNSKGKKVYGYLQPNVKKTVDQIVAELAKNPVLKKMYDEWCSLEQQKYETYTSAVQKFPPLEENKVFKPIKNAVIRAVLEMDLSTEMFAEHGEDVLDETESDEDLYIKWTAEYKSACTELYKNRDIPKAFELFRAESEKGNVLALHDLGKIYLNGLSSEKNITKALQCFEKALQGFLALEPTAKRLRNYVQYRIGKMFALGYGTKQDYSKAFTWFEKSATAGNKFAQYSLGSLYYYGNGVSQSYEKAFEYYKLSADPDNAYACYETAKMLRDGIGVEKNTAQADVYFKKAYNSFQKIAAENPDDRILYRLGVMTFSGTGCDVDRELGIEYIKQSAELGNEYAQAFLENRDKYNQTAAQNAVVSMLLSFGRMISDDYNRSLHGQKLRTEHKLKAAIRRKKQALGLKENPLENPQFKTC